MHSAIPTQATRQAHFWDQSFSFISPAVRVEIHRHRCFQLVITLTSTFDCTLAGQQLRGLKGFIVNQNIPHACRVSGGEVFVSFMEADSYWGRQLRIWLGENPYVDLAALLELTAFDSLLPEGHERMANEALIPYIDLFFNRIFPAPVETRVRRSGSRNVHDVAIDAVYREMDDRIQQALRFIDQHFHQRLMVDDIADHICLSPVRTRHLFTTATGTPISQYILWKRIKGALKATSSRQCTLADACIDFGFVDQPHFNRQFKQIFGISPTTLIKGGRMIF